MPSENSVLEPEFNKMAPAGVTVYASRMVASGNTRVERNLSLENQFESTAEKLATVANVIVFGCTSGSLVKGMEWDKEIINRIEARTKISATTTATAVVNALKYLGIEKMVVATPYVDEVNEKEREFFETHGFKVIDLKSNYSQRNGSQAVGRTTPEDVYRLAREVFSSEADGIFISCTNLRTIEIISKLEADVGKPVITSNQASMWEALRLANIYESFDGYGRLLTGLRKKGKPGNDHLGHGRVDQK